MTPIQISSDLLHVLYQSQFDIGDLQFNSEKIMEPSGIEPVAISMIGKNDNHYNYIYMILFSNFLFNALYIYTCGDYLYQVSNHHLIFVYSPTAK